MNNNKTGFVKLYRSILDKKWYSDTNAFILYTHLTLSANWEDCTVDNITLHKGSLLTSYLTLSRETKLSVNNIRTALKKLKQAGDIQVQSTPKYTVITISDWNELQGDSRHTRKSVGAPSYYKQQSKPKQEQSYDLQAFEQKAMNTIPEYKKNER